MVSSIGGGSYNAYVNVNTSVSSSTNSGKLSQLADKMSGIQQNINALVDQLMAEQEALGGMRDELKDLRDQLQSARQQKTTLQNSKPKQSDFNKTNKDGTVVADTDAYNKAMTAWNSANKSTLEQLDSHISTLSGKIDNLSNKIEVQQDQIDKTKDKIEDKKRELDNVSAESRRAQANGTSSTSGSTNINGSSDADDVRDAAELNKANQVKAQLAVGIATDSISASNVNKSAMSSLINVSAATTAGIDAQDSASVSVNIQLMWSTNYAENFSSALKSGDTASMQSQFSQFIKDIHSNGMPVDVNALVQQVLRESYVDTTADLKFYADKVQYFNDAKKMTREYVQDMRDYKTKMSNAAQNNDPSFCLSDPPSSGDDNYAAFQTFQKNYFSENPLPTAGNTGDATNDQMAADIGLPTSSSDLSDYTTAESLDDLIDSLEEKLSSIGDDSQLANTDLQNVLQKQQQTLQMMSNISKTLSDTALAVIRKIG